MITNEKLDEFKKHIEYLNGCCLKHGAVANPADIARLIKWSVEGSEEWGYSAQDCTVYAIFQIKSKAFCVLTESADYTGHG